MKKLLAEAELDKAMLKDVLGKKAAKPARRKRLVGYLQQHFLVSERRARRLIRISRKAIHYEPQRPRQDANLVSRLKTLRGDVALHPTR